MSPTTVALGSLLQISPMRTWNGASLMTSCKQKRGSNLVPGCVGSVFGYKLIMCSCFLPLSSRMSLKDSGTGAFDGTLGHPLCVEEVAWGYDIYWFTANSEWFGWLVGQELGWERWKDWGQGGLRGGMWIDLWEWAQNEGFCLFIKWPRRQDDLVSWYQPVCPLPSSP